MQLSSFRTSILTTQSEWMKKDKEQYKLISDCLHALMHVSFQLSGYRAILVDIQGNIDHAIFQKYSQCIKRTYYACERKIYC